MIPGIEIELGGRKLMVPPINLASLEFLHERLSAFKGGVSIEAVNTVLDATHAALKRNYPDIERSFLAEHLDVANMHEVMQAVMDVAGLRRKEFEAGKLKAASPSSTGGSSTAT
jgi:hypothetical protein